MEPTFERDFDALEAEFAALRDAPPDADRAGHAVDALARALAALEREHSAHEEAQREADRGAEARGRVTQLLESMSDGFYALDREWRFTYVNRRAERIWGISREQLLGRSVHDWPATEALFPRHQRAVDLRRVEKLEHFDAERGRWLQIALCPAADALYVFLDDITRRKRAEERLRRHEGEYHQLLDALPGNAWSSDASGRVTFVNRNWAAYSGLDLQGTIARAGEIIHADDRVDLTRVWREAHERGQPWEREYRLRRRDGVFRWHLARGHPVRGADGGITGWVGMATDVHEMKETDARVQRLYDEARQTSEQLARAIETKDEFLGLMSHELKTPITTILGNAEVLLKHRDALDPEAVRSSLTDIYDESARLHRTVEDLLSLARIERGQEIELEPLLLGRVVARVIMEHRTRFPARSIEFRVPDEPVPVMGERGYIEQVSRNLLSNAEKYSPRELPIHIDVRRSEQEMQVVIGDHGAGLTPEESELVFTPFVRLPRTAMQAAGSGIGLAVCRRLIEAQSGHIWAQPRRGGGSEFCFALPIADEPETDEAGF